MLTLYPPYLVPPSLQSKKIPDESARALVQHYGPPLDGWITNSSPHLANTMSAGILDNFWPMEIGIVPRGGLRRLLRLDAPVRTLFLYRAGNIRHLFASTHDSIYLCIPRKSAFTTKRLLHGQQSGAYISVAMQNDAGSFLSIVNGVDPLCLYDGYTWQRITSFSSPHAISGVDTSLLIYGWVYRNRQFFIERQSMNVWYLGINSVSGRAEKLPLTGIFTKGGSLLFGCTWSSDSGAGIDDRCLFVTNQGEFALFKGDPVDQWFLIGVYDIGLPLGSQAFLSVGGDIVIATQTGFIPVSAAISKDPSQLSIASLSRNISPDWQNAAAQCNREFAQSTPPPDTYPNQPKWSVIKWELRNMAIITPALCPKDNRPVPSHHACVFVVNLVTGKWARFTGWNFPTGIVFDDRLIFADHNGNLLEADVGGIDDGAPFSCRLAYAFDDFNHPALFKQSHLLRATFRHTQPFLPRFHIEADYSSLPSRQDQIQTRSTPSWDQTQWNSDPWTLSQYDFVSHAYPPAHDPSLPVIAQRWENVSASGHVLSVQLSILSDDTLPLDCQLISVDVTYETGDLVV